MSIEVQREHRESQPAGRGADLRAILQLIRRQWLIVLGFAIVVPVAALAYSLHATKEYTASATVLFRTSPAQGATGSSNRLVSEFDVDPARVVATNIQLVSLPAIVDATARAMHMAPAAIKGAITVSAGTGDTDAVEIAATNPSPGRAAALANTYAQQYISFRRNADVAKLHQARQLITAELARLGRLGSRSATGRQLANEANQLQIQAALQTGGAELVQTASPPTQPSSPSTVSNVVFGLLVGIVLGLAVAVLRHRIDRRLHTALEAAAIFDRPLLATVPYSRRMSENVAASPPEVIQGFAMLRANLRYFNLSGPRRTVVVTSPLPGDGKSTVVWNLAIAAAKASQRVLVVEADLRRPTMRQRIPGVVKHPHGLVEVLTDAVPLKDAIISVSIGNSEEGFDVIVAGTIPPNPIDLVESDRMASLLVEVGQMYDFVLVDTPPTAIVPDAIPILRQVDGVLVVCRLGQTTRPPAIHLRDHLHNLDASVLGVVVNGIHVREGDGYYGYGYSAAEQTSSASDTGGVVAIRATANVDPSRNGATPGEPDAESTAGRRSRA